MWGPSRFDPNFFVQPKQGTPCCPDGILRPDTGSTGYVCSKCAKVYTTNDLLNALNVPTKPTGPNVPTMVAVTGNTYPVKDELKQLGARWDNTARVWMVPQTMLARAQAIVARGPLPNNPPWTTPGRQSGPGVSTQREHETAEEQRFREYQQSARRSRIETRVCWECATPFTEADAAMNGVWEDYWCGCLDKPRQKQVKAKNPDDRPAGPPPTFVSSTLGRTTSPSITANVSMWVTAHVPGSNLCKTCGPTGVKDASLDHPGVTLVGL